MITVNFSISESDKESLKALRYMLSMLGETPCGEKEPGGPSEPTPSEPTPSEGTSEPTPSEGTSEPTPSEGTSESTPSEPTPSEELPVKKKRGRKPKAQKEAETAKVLEPVTVSEPEADISDNEAIEAEPSDELDFLLPKAAAKTYTRGDLIEAFRQAMGRLKGDRKPLEKIMDSYSVKSVHDLPESEFAAIIQKLEAL